MNRSQRVWWFYAMGLVLAIGAMVWLSLTSLDLERREATARFESKQKELVQRALYRLDAYFSSTLVREAGRDVQAYQSKKGKQRAEKSKAEIPSENVRLYFTVDEKGELQEAEFGKEGEISSAKKNWIGKLKETKNFDQKSFRSIWVQNEGFEIQVAQLGKQPPQGAQQTLNVSPNPDIGQSDYQSPAQELQKRTQYNYQSQFVNQSKSIEDSSTTGFFNPFWVETTESNEELFFARNVSMIRNGEEEKSINGIWMDWPSLKKDLLNEISDILPSANLLPVKGGGNQNRMASIPVKLDPMKGGAVSLPWFTPLRITIFSAWAALIIASLTAGFAIRAFMDLSDRRGQFVSAVTHELRTPLTTFSMYSQMLADGMVAEEKKQSYLHTLKSEASRLSKIVENVLAYARVEGGKSARQMESISVDGLVSKILPSLQKQAEEAKLKLEIHSEVSPDRQVLTDVSLVEQILTNLVENACKYGASADQPRIALSVEEDSSHLALRVKDFGSGVSPEERETIFEPFQRGKGQSSHAISGVGLGLALSKALAHELGGDLRLDPDTESGASFSLTIPLS